MKKGSYKISTMSRKDLDTAVNWAATEGWNPGLYDADTFYATDPKGFFIGKINDKPVSCISAVAYDKKFGFIGFYIVKKEYRGKGLGFKIWKTAINYLKNQNIGLDGVVVQQEDYKKSGFKLAYRNIRYQGLSEKAERLDLNIIKLSKIPFNKLFKYDKSLFPAERKKFLECWVKLPQSYAFGFLNKRELKGYGVIRKCKVGYKVGPLFADNKKIAEQLFLALNNSVPEKSTIFLDVPEVNKEALNLTKKYQMKYVFETARMYTKRVPKIDLTKVFGVTTFELG